MLQKGNQSVEEPEVEQLGSLPKLKAVVLQKVDNALLAHKFDSIQASVLAGMQEAPDSVEIGARIMMGIQKVALHCWLIFGSTEDDKPVIAGSVTVAMMNEPLLNRKEALIYSFHVTATASRDIRELAFETVLDFVRKRKCTRLNAYVNSDSIKNMVRRLGFDSEWALFYKEI